jgi:heterotetrameric sarcosine oxidase gamma subunit
VADTAAPIARGPIARSPIGPALPVTVVAGWEVSGRRSDAPLTVTDCTPLAKVAVRGRVARLLDVPFGRAARRAESLVIGAGPGEWLILGPPGTAASLIATVSGATGGSGATGSSGATSVDLTHGRALVRLTGARAVDVLARLTAIDLADDVTPDGAALRTSVAALATDIVRDDRQGTRSYLLHCERSSGQYLFDTLVAAGGEFGIDTDGFIPPGI